MNRDIHVTLVLAMSADGKIARVDRAPVRFAEADATRLEALCAEADALVMGAGTLRRHGTTRTIVNPALAAARRERGQAAQPLTCIVSRSGELDRGLAFFVRQAVPRAIATTAAGASRAAGLADLAEIWVCGDDEVAPQAVLGRLSAYGARRVALLGGGELTAAWFEADTVDRVELTVAPVIFGGAAAPTPVDGPGLSAPRPLVLREARAVDGLVFLSFDVDRSSSR